MTRSGSSRDRGAVRFDAAAFTAHRSQLHNRLGKAIIAFDASFGAGEAAARDEWHAYLKWDQWAKPFVDHGQWNAPTMKRVAWRLYAAKAGFENPLILDLRQALTDCAVFDEAVLEANGNIEREFQRRFDGLNRAAASDPLDFAALEAAAWWLAATGQAPDALARVRAQFSAPVFVVQVHRELVENKLKQFERTSREERTTRHQIQGATVVGAASVQSRTTAALLDAPTDVRVRVTTVGTLEAPRNVATSGRVRVNSSSHGQFTAVADLYWNGERFAVTAPRATAQVQSAVTGISAPWLLRRAAARRVNSSRGAAEAESRTIIAREAEAAMAERLDAMVVKVTSRTSGFLNFLTRIGSKAERWTTELRDSSVQIGFQPPSHAGLGARPHPIPPLVGNETIGLSLHDAALEAIFRPQVAGKLWTDVNFSMLQRELTGGTSEEMMIGLDPGRWSAQWSWRLPVRIHFTAENVVVRYRFARAEIDGASYDAPFEVVARLKISAPPLGMELKLPEPATVVSLDPQRPLPPHFQSFLERKFRGLFGKGFHLDGLQFPAGGALDPLSAFHPASVSLENNWVHLRYTNRKPQPPLAAQQVSAELAEDATP